VVEQGPVEAIFHAPKHPYTQALLRSIPSPLAKPRTRLATLKGSVPHPLARPSGCPFHPRCGLAVPGLCDRVEPTAHVVGAGHAAACHLYVDPLEAARLTPADVA
jgi:peptide/nickel transport system ATP-binding protein